MLVSKMETNVGAAILMAGSEKLMMKNAQRNAIKPTI